MELESNLAHDAALDYPDVSLDDLARLNESLELNCAIQAHLETELQQDGVHCPTSFDSILCWPRTAAGQVALLPCLAEFKGVHYDKSREYLSLGLRGWVSRDANQIHIESTLILDFPALRKLCKSWCHPLAESYSGSLEEMPE